MSDSDIQRSPPHYEATTRNESATQNSGTTNNTRMSINNDTPQSKKQQHSRSEDEEEDKQVELQHLHHHSSINKRSTSDDNHSPKHFENINGDNNDDDDESRSINSDMNRQNIGGIGGGDAPQSAGRKRNASAFMTALNILKSYMGSGILGLPYAFAEGGLIGSLLIMIFLGVIATHAMYLLVRAKQMVLEEGHQVTTYGDVAEHCYGKVGLYTVNAMLIFTQFGFCCVYVVFVVTNSVSLLNSFNIVVSNVLVAIIFLPVFIGLSWIRTMKFLSVVSAFSIFTITASAVIILVASIINIIDIIQSPNPTWDITIGVEWKTIAIMLGMGIYAYEGIGVVLPCESAIKKPKQFNPTLIITLLIASTNYIMFGLIPYLSFGQQTSDLITSNLAQFASEQENVTLWNTLSLLVTVGLITAITGTFPLQLFVVTDIAEEWMFREGRLSQLYRYWKENLFRTILVVSATIIALVFPNFGVLVSLIGSIGSSSLQFVFPALFILKIMKRKNIFFVLLMIFYIAFGIVAGIMGTIQTFFQMVNDFQANHSSP